MQLVTDESSDVEAGGRHGWKTTEALPACSLQICMCSLANLSVMVCAMWYHGLLLTNPGWLEAVASYAYSFTVAATWRASLRKQYGFQSEEAKNMDESVLAVFGVYLIDRGSTSHWVYPLMCTLPAYLMYSVVYWFTRQTFPIECRVSHNTLTLDDHHCIATMTAWDLHAMLQYIAADIAFMYGLVKSVAVFMVRMDPQAKGTLSELKAWEEKAGRRR